MSETSTVAIVGAGPYGLSLAAHLAAAGIDTRVFGSPMSTWHRGMPRGMLLKSEGFASSLSDPARSFTLGHYCRERGIPYRDIGWPVPVEVFADYGVEFQRRFVPHLDTSGIGSVALEREGFRIETRDGEASHVGRVVVATGIGPFARVPSELAALPPSALSHSGENADYSRFAGLTVAVIGAGASALDAAASLRRAGASALLVSRSAEVKFYLGGRPRRAIDALLSPMTPLGPGWKKWLCCEAPLLFHALPERVRTGIVRRYLGPSPARFVRDTIEGHVPYHLRSEIVSAGLAADGRVDLAIETAERGRSVLRVDHVVAATGYKVDVAKLGFLGPEIVSRIATVDRSPALSRDFESSVPGLHFLGTPSAYSFGPMFRFACGADYAARRVTRHVVAARRHRGPAADTHQTLTLSPRASRA